MFVWDKNSPDSYYGEAEAFMDRLLRYTFVHNLANVPKKEAILIAKGEGEQVASNMAALASGYKDKLICVLTHFSPFEETVLKDKVKLETGLIDHYLCRPLNAILKGFHKSNTIVSLSAAPFDTGSYDIAANITAITVNERKIKILEFEKE